MKQLFSILALSAMCLTAGCAKTGVVASSEMSPSTASESLELGKLDEIKNRYVKAGFHCDEWSIGDQLQLASASGSCEEGVRIGYFVDATDLEKQVAASRNWTEEYDLGKRSWVVGEDWIIETNEAKQVAKNLGGKIVII
ncbi:hypothetical protein [Paeniglutamicibacter antarcticus]|uniref:Lipoprotein n=1 Tax=Paeniglutamicibacter antarcticus TaxID=494023 RepID=A0ABP9THJ7_9MICC